MTKKPKPPVQRPTPSQIHELKITIKDSKPPIWRTVAVPSDIRLSDLHMVIQAVFGWENCHLHQFILRNKQPKPTREELATLTRAEDWDALYRRLHPDRYFSLPIFKLEDVEDERKFRLRTLVPVHGDKIEYEYDFGDDWVHVIEVKRIGASVDGVKYPVCLGGKFAGPPEDSHGIWGYYEMLEAVKDPRHPMHRDYKEWLSPDFDPNHFDLDETNALLTQLRIRQ
jgi:hypothetical protein